LRRADRLPEGHHDLECSVPPVALRPRSTTEIIDAAASLLRQNYLELVTATALFTVPLFIANELIAPQMGIQPGITTVPFGTNALAVGSAGAYSTSLFQWAMLSAAIAFVFGGLASATTVVIVSDNYLGREVTIAGALARALSRFWAVIVTGVVQGMLIGVGFVFLLIPGFFCIAWFFSAVNVVMVEGKNPFEALGRGHFLAKGSVLRVLGTLFFTGLIITVAAFVVGLVLRSLIMVVHTGPQAAVIADNLARIVIYPFFTVVATVLYFDLRIRKEGLDLELMAKELGVALPGAVPA
jgi:hypothetical protein